MMHARTTVAGITLIVGAILTFAGEWLASGAVPGPAAWGALGGAFTIGAGFIAAADGKNVPKDPPAP